MSFWFDLDGQYRAAFEKWWFLQCCSSFRGSSSIWGAKAPRVVKMASQLGILSSLAYQADSSSPFIHQTWIFCKENGSKRSFLPEIEVQTFWYTLYAVTTACCVPWQIPKEIWKNTAGKSANPTPPLGTPTFTKTSVFYKVCQGAVPAPVLYSIKPFMNKLSAGTGH